MRFAPILLVAALPFVASAQNLQPGNYRTTMTGDMPGMEGKPVVGEQCFTQKDIDSGLTQMGVQKDADCKVSDFKRSPGRISYRMTCVHSGKTTTTDVEGALGAETFDIKMVSKMPEFPKPITFRSAGKRVGNCK